MDLNIHKLRMEAARIAARHRRPAFYLQFQAPLAMARGLYHSNPLVKELRDLVGSRLSEDLGHGLFHSTRVSIESAALIFVEAEGQQLPPEHIQRLMVLGQLAGLLHDICRGEDNHASAGALEAARVLVSFPLSGEETQSICCAIANHEAFVQPVPCGLPWAQMVSDCLYDADKFRWGLDNFTQTVWHLAESQNLSTRELIDRFPWGMTGIARIRETFRSAVGRQYGPDIIDVGIEIGKEVYQYLVQIYGNE